MSLDLRPATGADISRLSALIARVFARTELMATLPGLKLYAPRGYVAGAMARYDPGAGESIEFVPMTKDLR